MSAARIAVVARQQLRPLHDLRLAEHADRHHRAALRARVDVEDVVDLVPVRLVGLQIDLPDAAEQIELVDVEAADGRLQRVEHVRHGDAEHLRLVAVDVEIELRRVGGEGREHAGQFRLLVGRDQHRPRDRGDVERRLALQRLQHELEAAGAAETEDRRQVERERDGLVDRRELRPQLRDDGGRRARGVAALVIGRELDDEERLVGRGHAVEEVEADDRQHARDAGHALIDVLRLRDHVAGAVERGALGQPHRREQRALILLGQEALRRQREQIAGRRRAPRSSARRRASETRTSRCDQPAIAVAGLVDAARARSAAARGSAARA